MANGKLSVMERQMIRMNSPEIVGAAAIKRMERLLEKSGHPGCPMLMHHSGNPPRATLVSIAGY